MQTKPTITVDGNEAVASVAYRPSEIAVIYPITVARRMATYQHIAQLRFPTAAAGEVKHGTEPAPAGPEA